MNFKTTLILIVLLAVAAVALFVTRGREADETASTQTDDEAKRLLDVKAEDVTRISVAPADGEKVVLEKQGTNWRLAEPVQAPADAFEVDSLVRDVANLESRGRVEAADGQGGSATGLHPPRFVIELTTEEGKTTTVNVGERSAVGGNLYVAPAAGDGVHLVAADVWDKLQAPASQYRRKNLFDTATTEVKQLTVARADGTRLVMHRVGDAWQLVEPQQMPLEKTEVDDLLFGLSGMRAEEFVDAAGSPSLYQLDNARVTVTASTEAPATQPAATQASTQPATQPTGTTVKLGRYTDVRRQSVFASVEMPGGTATIAKVPASVVETFDVEPLDLRDRKVLDINPDQVMEVRITSDLRATTQPTTREPSRNEVVLARRNEPAATQPATTQASTAPATQEAPKSKWVVASAANTDAADSTVTTLLQALHPLRASKYVESSATTQPTDTHVLHVTTGGLAGAPVTEYEIRLIDRGGTDPLLATYGDLSFEVDRSLLSKLTADFTQATAPATPPAMPSMPGMPMEP
jgi:hypothetical protein